MFRQLRSTLWYLRRPRLYREMVRKAWATALGRRGRDGSRAKAERWCSQRAISAREAIRLLTGSPPSEPIASRFPAVFAAAQAAAAKCPVEMGGAANLDLLFAAAEALEAQRAIETGVAYGWSSLALLLSLSARPGGRLVSTDMPYTGRNNDRFVGCVVPRELRPHWRLIDRADRDGLPLALRDLPAIDLCHYDSDKSYAGRMWAYPRLFAALRPGGCFISDDVGDNRAFRDFCRAVGRKPIVVESDGKYVGVLVKDADPPLVPLAADRVAA